MKFKSLLILLFLFFLLNKNACSATYYLSSSTGNDLNSGTQQSAPWKTLEKLNSQILVAGDSVLLKCGDTFFGTIILNSTGSFSSPIYFGNYGFGQNPIITGFKKLTNWTSVGNIYSSSDTDYVKSIWLNGKWMQPARYPNTGFLETYFTGLNGGLYTPNLIQPDSFWNNADVVVRTSGFQYEIASVYSFSQGFVVFDSPVSVNIPVFNGYFFQNHLASLDTLNEWFCDTLNNQVILIPPLNSNMSIDDVEGSVIDFGFKAIGNSDFISIDGIDFSGQSKDAIKFVNESLHIGIRNCHFSKIKGSAINFDYTSTDAKISNNKIEDCGADAIRGYLFYSSCIEFNEIERTGLHAGFSNSNLFSSIGINVRIGFNDTIQNNLVDSSAYAGIFLLGSHNLIRKNFINNSMLLLEEGGGLILSSIYTYQNTIKDNFILNTHFNVDGTHIFKPISGGIYFNYYCYNDSLYNNTIVNSWGTGIYFMPFNHHIYLEKNLIYNSNQGQIFIADGDTNLATNNIQLHHNILYSLSEKQKVLQLNGTSLNFFPVKGDSNYYCNPYDYFPIYQYANQDTVTVESPFSLQQWNQTTQQDSNSHVSNVVWQNYATTDTTGSDEIVNGDFTNNYDGWNTQPLNENSLLLDNLTMLDGGCVKFQIPDSAQSNSEKIISNSFPILQNQFYQFGFSVAAKKSTTVLTDIAMPVYPYYQLGMHRYFPIDTARKNYNFIFSSDVYGDPLVLNLELDKQDSLVYFDNIHLLPVTVFKHDSTRMSVLLMNYSPNTTTVTLPSDSVFLDLDGNIVPGSYTLPPYSSYVLVLDSPLNLVSVKEIQKENSITVFPNPVQSAFGKIFIQLPDADKYDFEIYDVLGQKQQNGKFSGATMNFVSVKNYSDGLYILNIHSAKKQWQQKIIVVN